MKVGIIGGTGFVGTYLTEALLRAGHEPSLLVRPGSEEKLGETKGVRTVSGDLGSATALLDVLTGCDAAIFNVGILREFPERGISFDELHLHAARRVMQAAEQSGIKRFLLMSANGVKADGTAYQASKFASMPRFARASRGHIALQDHGDDVWYRNLKIRELEAVHGE